MLNSGADLLHARSRRSIRAVGSSEIFAPGLLDGQVALVTGGGTGLGRASAAELIACGAQVVIAGRRSEVLAATCERLGRSASWVEGDIRDDASAAAIVDCVLERHGRLDLLVNNAGGQYFVPAEAIAARGGRRSTGSTSAAPRG